MNRLTILLSLLLAATSALAAKDGELDTLYGGVELGRVRVAYDLGGNLSDAPAAIRVLLDGRTVVVGSARNASGSPSIAVAVRLPSGLPDTSVAPNGRYTIPVTSGHFDSLSPVAIDVDGSYYVVGRTPDLNQLRVWRYALSGALLGGPFDLGAANRKTDADSAIVLHSGNLMIAANAKPIGTDDSALDATLLRMTPAGVADPLFGGAGIVTLRFDAAERDDAFAVRDVGNQTYVVCGRVGAFGSAQRWGIAHLRRDGSLITTFGGTGKIVDQLLLNDAPGDTPCNDIGVLNTGTIIRFVMTGRACAAGGACQTFVIPYTTAGELISSFGDGGIRMVDYGTSATQAFPRIAIGEQGHDIGRIYLAMGFSSKLAVTRLNSLGADDLTFATSGAVTNITMSVPAIGGTARPLYPRALDFGPTGLQIAASVTSDGASNNDFALMRLHGNVIARDGFE